MDRRDVFLTGVPRSGTTLTCELLNLLGDTVALDEPMGREDFTARGSRRHRSQRPITGAEVCKNIEAFARSMRRSLGAEGVDMSKRSGRKGEIRVEKALSPDFLLVLNHHAGFLGVLDELVTRGRVFAVVRNPLAALVSWQSVSFPVQRGHSTLAELFHPRSRASWPRSPIASIVSSISRAGV
jgi:hypothetical protein